MDTFFAVSAPGIESITKQELENIIHSPLTTPAVTAANLNISAEEGGVSFRGDLELLYRAHLQLRSASRVLARLGVPFMARDFDELTTKASRLPWEKFLRPGQGVALRATCYRSKLYHEDAVIERMMTAISLRLGKPSRLLPAEPDDSGKIPQLVVIRLTLDSCSVSVDASGELLHRRGYRQAIAKAPLRETMAAAMLYASDWDKTSPLIDPFCGSGTIPIEAALLARGMAVGAHRRFAFMNWPSYDKLLWKRIGDSLPAPTACPPIFASDRDAGAIEMAKANAERAGVRDDIVFSCNAVSAIEPPVEHGWIVTNPPYGLRVSEGKDLRNLYAQFGNVVRAKCPNWHVAMMSSDIKLIGHTGLHLDTSLDWINGGIKVRVGKGVVEAAAKKE